jgi:hypothetical protein
MPLPYELWERIILSLLPDFSLARHLEETKLYEVNSTFKEIVFRWKYGHVTLMSSRTTIDRQLARAR